MAKEKAKSLNETKEKEIEKKKQKQNKNEVRHHWRYSPIYNTQTTVNKSKMC